MFDESTTYAVKAFLNTAYMSPKHFPGEGYGLIADENTNEPGKNFIRKAHPKWAIIVPIRARGMVLAKDTLFLGGCKDIISKDDSTAVYEGRGEAMLWAISASKGRKIAEYKIDAGPVNDGLSAAQGKLFISATDGTILCMGPK